jgi:PAS domain S-box-containing protein
MKDSSKTKQELIAEISVLKKRIQELEQSSSEKIREENERRARQLTVLHETSVELTAELNLDALLHSIAQRALNLIGGAACNCYLYNPQTDLLERVVSAGTALIPSPKTRHRGEGMVGQVWVKGTPLLVNDYASWSGRTRAYDSFPSRALVAAPFHWGTEILGVLNIMAPQPHQYTQMDVEMLSLFAAQAAIAIQNVRLHDRMKMELAERERTAEALRESEELLRSYSENAPEGIYLTDLEGNFLYGNRKCEEIIGYRREELIGKNFLELNILPEKSLNKAVRLLQANMEGKPTGPDEIELISKEGYLIPVEINTTVVQRMGRRIILSFVQDITKRKRAEETLKESENKYRLLADNVNDVIFALDMNLNYTYVSPSIKILRGYEPEEVLKQPPLEALTPSSRDLAMRALSEVMELEKSEHRDILIYRTLQLEMRRKDGTTVWTEVTFSFIRDENQRPTGILGVARDITNRKRAEETLNKTMAELERSNKDLEQFAYVASHDLQEPLRMVSSYTQLLSQHYEGQLDEKAKKFMDYARDGAVRMQGLINDLLTYSRVGTRGKPLETADAHALLGEAIRNLAAMIEENRAIITNDDLPTVRADASQLIQVFQNLISNAIKFQRENGPHIHVSAQNKRREWVFSIRDNGIGIDRQYADRIFIIFQRLHTRQEYPGTGIGLALCKRIVERHGGKIWFESEPGKGTTFFFTIPK